MFLKDPPRDSISCNRIAKYVVEMAPPPGQGETRSWELPGGTNRMLSVPGLQPFTEYCVSLYLQTDAGYSSPRSDQACIVTPQTSRSRPIIVTSQSERSRPIVVTSNGDRSRPPSQVPVIVTSQTISASSSLWRSFGASGEPIHSKDTCLMTSCSTCSPAS